MSDYTFLEETSNNQKIKIFFVSILLLLMLTGFVLSVKVVLERMVGEQGLASIGAFFAQDIKNLTSIGLFYLSFIGGLFFIPLPLEAFFFTGLVNGNSAIFSFLMIIAGLIPAQIVDYYLGLKLGGVLLTFISKKKVYKTKRWVNSYGSYAIFLSNLIPFLPAPLLSFAVGITRYNAARLFTLVAIGSGLKYLCIIWFFTVFS